MGHSKSALMYSSALLGLMVFTGTAQAQGQQSQDQAAAAAPENTIVVSGIRASLKSSIGVKRAANAVIDVITAEGIGKFPDRNVAESLAHIPGVSVDHQFGAGEKVAIQGTDPALNRILVDDHSIASTDWGGAPGDVSGRTFNYTLLAPEIVSRIEVYKSPEARIDEGSLGGTVIVRTRQPLDLKPNTINGSVGGTYNDRSNKGDPRASLLYSWHNKDATFGVLVAGTYDKQTLTRAGIEYFGYSTGADFFNTNANGTYTLKNPNAQITGGSLSDLYNARYPVGINHAYFVQTRERIGTQGALQWKPSDRLELSLTGMHIQANYNNFSQSEFIYPGWATGQLQSANVSNGLINSASFGSTTLPSTSSELDMNYRKTTVTNDSANLAWKWKVGKATISGNGGWSKATGGTDPEYLFSMQSNVPYSFSYSGTQTNVNYASDPTNPATFFRGDASKPVTLANGTTINGYQIGGISRAMTTDAEGYGQLDGEIPVDDSFFSKVRMGVKYTSHVNRLDAYGSQVYYTSQVGLSNFNTTLTPAGVFSGLGASGNANQFATMTSQNVINALSNGYILDTGKDLGSSFRVLEKNAAAYVQLDFERDKWRGNLGYRMVYTKDISDYAEFPNNATVGTPTRSSTDYLKFLPGFNVSYQATSDLLLRGSIAEVIARPRYAQLAGSFSRNDTQFTASGGNPDLKPYQSWNFEASAEWYFRPGALFSLEYFRRQIKSYIVTTTNNQSLFNTLTGQYAIYSVSSPINASNAVVNGISASFQAPIWGGFGIQTNYTFAVDQKGTDAAGDVLNLPYLSRHTINVVPYYEKGKFQARVSWNYRTHYFTGIGRLNSVDSTDGYHQLDFSAGYKINEHFTINFNAQNLLDSTYYSYSGTKDAPTALYKNGRTFSGSASFTF